MGEVGALRTGKDVSSGVPFTPTGPLAFGWNKSAQQSMSVSEVTDPVLSAPSSQPAVYIPAEPLPFDTTQIASKSNYSNPKAGDPCHPLCAGAHAPAIAFALRGREEGAVPEVSGDGSVVNSLRAAVGGSSRDYVAQGGEPLRYGPSQQDTMHFEEGVVNTLPAGTNHNGGHYTKTFTQGAVRRLTPRECERLMGWPDDWTRYGTRPDGTTYELADGPRYEICGNGWAADVAIWIGKRVLLVQGLLKEREEDVAA